MKRLARILVSVLFLAAAFAWFDWASILNAISKVRPAAFAMAVIVNLLILFLLALRWHCLMREVGQTSLRIHLYQYFAAVFANSFTPAGVGGDVFRAFSAKKSLGFAKTVALLFRERLLGLFGYLAVVLFSFCILKFNSVYTNLGWREPLGLAASVSALGLVLIICLPFFISAAEWILKASSLYRRVENVFGLLRAAWDFPSIKDFLTLGMLTLLGIVLWTATFHIIAADMAMPIPWLVLALVASTVEVIRFVPLSIQGIGVREGAFALLLAGFGYSHEASFALAATAYIGLTLSMLAAGGIAVICKMYLVKEVS